MADAQPDDEAKELEQIEAALASGGASPATPAVTVPAASEPTPEPTPDATEVEPTPEPTPVPTEEAEPSGRFRLKGNLAAVAELVKEGMPEAEAIERVYGKKEAQAPEPTPDPMEALTAELADQQRVIDAAAEDQSLFTPELAKAIERKQEIRDQIRDLKQQRSHDRAAQVQTAQQKYDATWAESEEWRKERYPDSLKPESPLTKAVAAELDAIASNENHPLWGNAELPKILFAKHAAELGIAPVVKKAAPAATPARVLPASGSQKTTPAVQPNEAQRQADFKARQAKAVEENDAEELYQLAEEELTGKRPSRHPALRLG